LLSGGPSDLEVEGATAFHAPPATTYRYVLELQNEKLSIWMEDPALKKQWCDVEELDASGSLTALSCRYKGGLAQTDYVTSTNAIPGATAIDYTKVRCRLPPSTPQQTSSRELCL